MIGCCVWATGVCISMAMGDFGAVRRVLSWLRAVSDFGLSVCAAVVLLPFVVTGVTLRCLLFLMPVFWRGCLCVCAALILWVVALPRRVLRRLEGVGRRDIVRMRPSRRVTGLFVMLLVLSRLPVSVAAACSALPVPVSACRDRKRSLTGSAADAVVSINVAARSNSDVVIVVFMVLSLWESSKL